MLPLCIVPNFICLLWDASLTTNTHTPRRDEGKRKTLFSSCDSSSDAGTGLLSPIEKRWWCSHSTRPASDDSALRSLADDSACSSFDALFSTNTHLSFFLLFTAQHDSMFFRFFLYDSSRLYWIQEKNLCCYYLKSFFFACKSCDFWGEGEELQRFYFRFFFVFS